MQRPSVGAPGAPGGGAPGAPPSTGHLSGGEHEVDNRSRNARAQRRHREKRKAHFKAVSSPRGCLCRRRPPPTRSRNPADPFFQLEESVQILTQQLEEARRQLGAATYANSARFAYSPESKDIASLTAENAYLRDENADLRRQLYTLRVSHGGGSSGRDMGTLPPTGDTKVTTGIWPEAKTESAAYSSGGGVYSAPNSAVLSSPRVGPSSSHGRTMSHPGDFVRVRPGDPLLRAHAEPPQLTWQDPAAEGSSSSTSSYPPPLGYQISGGVVEGSSSDKWSTGGETSTRHGQQRGSSSSSRGRMPSAVRCVSHTH